MIQLNELVAYIDGLLQPANFKDYCPNGLQISGKSNISTIVTGVTANQALIDQAVAKNADVILVHHGLFWKGEPLTLTGMKYRRIKPLINHEIGLLAYHLPLDAHSIYGNNSQLGKLLNINFEEAFEVEPGLNIGFLGKLASPMSSEEFAETIATKLQRTPLHIPGSRQLISKIAWCTGAAQDFIIPALEHGVDAYLTGEVSERTVHIATENNIHFFAAGHHATERYGVKALGEHLAKHFNITHHFIDIDNPV